MTKDLAASVRARLLNKANTGILTASQDEEYAELLNQAA